MLLNNGVAFVAAILGIFCFSKFKDSEVKYFIFFLIYVALMQLIGSYPYYADKYEFLNPIKHSITDTRIEHSYWFFTIFWSVGSALFYSYYFRLILNNVFQKRIIKILTYVFILYSIIYVLIWPEELFNGMIPSIKIYGAIIILLSAIFYLMDILKTDKVLTFYKSINFFISAVIFIWWLVTTPVTFYQVYFSSADWSFVFLRWQIFLFMNLFMYLTFAFAFIWCKPEDDLLKNV